ncbi:hypothetical protein OY671_009463, partial [Metschnikowia pulcherrima]
RVSQQRHAMGPDFIQLSGEDMTALAYMAAGGHGCISVVANVAPKQCADSMVAVLKGDYAAALKIQDRLTPSHDAIFKEPGLAGAKHGLKSSGRVHEEVRSPLVPVTAPTGKVIHDAMEFKKFASKGNVVDLAVGVIIGAAFGGIVTSMVGDIIMPIIGAITGGLDFSNYFTGLSKSVTATNLADAKKQG